MITLEQIRLLESKITRAIELIRVLKEENTTLRKGLESAQRRMKELETLVDGFKADQHEIESVIVRTLRNLDDLEESAATPATPGGAGGIPAATAGGIQPGGIQAAAGGGVQPSAGGVPPKRPEQRQPGIAPTAPAAPSPGAQAGHAAAAVPPGAPADPQPKEELDIF